MLFTYTVIEVLRSCERASTSCGVWGGVRSARRRGRGRKRLSDFSSDFVKHGCALLGIVAASAKREALCLAGSSGLCMHGVLGVEGGRERGIYCLKLPQPILVFLAKNGPI